MPEAPAPKTNVLKLSSESFSGAFQKAASVLGPGGGRGGAVSACRHFKELCFSLHSPALLVFEADAVEAVSLVPMWKVGV